MIAKPGFRAVFIREVKRLAKSKVYIWGAIVANILSMTILVFLMNSGLPSKMPIAVVDLDDTQRTRSLIQKLDAGQRVDVKYNVPSFRDATRLMNQGEVYGILLIPRNFTSDVTRGTQPKMSYYLNMGYKIPSALITQDMLTIGVLTNAQVGQMMAMKKGVGSAQQIGATVMPIRQETHPLNNPYLNYSILLNGIILACFIQLTTMLFTVSSIGTELKNNTVKNWISSAGGSTWSMMAGKFLPNTIIMSLVGLLEISILNYYNGFPMHSGFWYLFVAYVLLVMAAQSFAIILFSVFQNYRMSVSMASLLGMLSFSLIGFSYPTSQMSPLLDSFSQIYPIKAFYLIFSDQALNGYPLKYSFWRYFELLCFAFVAVILFWRIRKIVQFSKYEP